MTGTTVFAVGLMSGTSLDGIDAALVETDGEGIVRPRGFHIALYEPGFASRLRGVLGRKAPNGETDAVERELTLLHARAVGHLLADCGMRSDAVTVVGFHGHTLHHEPECRFTWQLGDGELLAAETRIQVVSDFRSADVAGGGEGAPLAPAYHAALAADMERPLAVLNIGGVANVTWIGEDGALIAFDTGPGNALIDDWTLHHTGKPMDRDGSLARSGTADAEVLGRLLSDPYFARRPPKSLDRNAFDVSAVEPLPVEDGAATLTRYTAASVAKSLDHLPAPPRRWIVSGGGRRNPVLMDALRDCLGAAVDPVEAVGWNGDALEAQAFAFLAVRRLWNLPTSFPATTGVAGATSGGVLHPAGKAAAAS